MTKIPTTLLTTFLLLTTSLMAQSETAKIKGKVTDETGATTQEKGWSDEQIKTVTGAAPTAPNQGSFDEAERTLQRASMEDNTPDETSSEMPIETLSAKPGRKTQGEAED